MNPITPIQAALLAPKSKTFPSFVIRAFNEMIVEHLDEQRHAKFTQSDVLKRIRKLGDVETTQIFRSKWLDVEPLYRSNGWTVIYDKPAYNEDYEPTFEFKAKGGKI